MFRDPRPRPKSLELTTEGRRASAPSDSRSGQSSRRWRNRLQDGQTSPEIPSHGGQTSRVPRRRSTSETTNSDPRPQPAHVSTNSTQGSRTSATGKKIKPTSEADLYPEDNHPVSRRSLPDFLKAKPALFWPRAPNGEERQRVIQGVIVENPDTAFLQGDSIVVGASPKSKVLAGRFEADDGTDEHLAVKIVLCDDNTMRLTKEAKPHERNEFENLLAVDHPHIIWLVGSFEDTRGADRRFGILLYPLALSNLEQELTRISNHNHNQLEKGQRGSHERVKYLLSYLPCLCRALLYLHEMAIRHQDVKPSNILMDRDYNVILADFDIAKKHTSKTQDITDSKVSNLTVKYAPKRVKEQRQRGRDWDIYSLGCVFLEIATVIMGETMTNLHRHLICGDDAPQERWQEVELYYYEAVENKHVDSWIDHLKQSFRCLPQQEAPVTIFTSDKVKQRFKDSESCLDEFFRQIHNMLHAKPGDEGILEEAVNCFNLLSEKDCQHCRLKGGESVSNSLQPPPRVGSSKPLARPPFDPIIEASPAPTVSPNQTAVNYVPLEAGIEDRLGSVTPERFSDPGSGIDRNTKFMDHEMSKRQDGPAIVVTPGTVHEQDAISNSNPESYNQQAISATTYVENTLSLEPSEYVESSEQTDPSTLSTRARPPAEQQSPLAVNPIRQEQNPVSDSENEVAGSPPEEEADDHRFLSVDRPALEVSSTHSPANSQEFIRSYGRAAKYEGNGKRLRGHRILEYDIDTKAVKPVKKADLKDSPGLFYDLPRLANPTLRLPNRDTEGRTIGGTLRPRKALSTMLNIMRAAGTVRQLFVPGMYSKEEVDKCMTCYDNQCD